MAAISEEHDLALLRCQTLNLPQLLFSNKGLNLGQSVMAIGYPNTSAVLGLPPESTQTNISSIFENCPDMVLCSTTLNSGSSGGPLLDATGRVAGINTFVFLLDHGVSGGVQANAAISFLEQNVPGFLAAVDERNEVSWPEITSSGIAATVFIEVSFGDAVPALSAKAGSNRMSGGYFIDDSCLVCRGIGRVACPSRSCHAGKLSERYTITVIEGSGEGARAIQVPKFREIDCPNCVGGAVVCPACRGSGKARN